MKMTIRGLLAVLATTTMLAGIAEARTLKWARSGDSLTLDPHAQNEGPTHTLAHQIYEPLIIRDHTGKQLPALATSWSVTSDPTVWEFKLRTGVKFHDGADFDADDVVFSLERAMQPTSDMKGLLTSIDSVSKVDQHTVRIKTKGPNPLLPNNLGDLFMMDKGWAEKNNATKVQDFKNREENFAVRNANGTGPFSLVSREPDVKTVLKRNDNYWGKAEVPLEVTEVIYTPIKADATRIAALLSGEIDFVQDLPVQDIERLRQDRKLRVNSGPENRTIFFGFNVGDADLKTDNVEGKNPFADKRVRQAMNMALNRTAIQRVVMRGESVPTGVIMPPFVNGWTKELDAAPAVDAAAARKLLADAGYPNGFSTTLHCPNDRYVNDEAICQAAVGMWGAIGVKVNLVSQSKSIHFTLIQKQPPETDFFMLGWGVPTFDSDYVFSFLYHTRAGSRGSWNALRYSNAEIDSKIQTLSSETDIAKRNATIADIWGRLKEEALYIPLHHQTLAYGMKSDLDIPVDVSNQPKLKFVSFKRS
ncbi:MAG: ABC transporter substrate-binding protein [Methylobacterium sp.]|nr:ABC transporter substrate-binding protein [Methylobacterium sp.]MCA3601456.1 ABC transporter substrate-binding protein [Methylobacterium sp.]MCA3605600.1 ABC transporter substrate-binding protein [Methylobacterium sp.]MCA3608066.1 ABC transporter substrate-binding protein [Methylobacterium sp.]MCA3613518.1 ABC transporter substrate-binding protein [Methylobacterium sp.]